MRRSANCDDYLSPSENRPRGNPNQHLVHFRNNDSQRNTPERAASPQRGPTGHRNLQKLHQTAENLQFRCVEVLRQRLSERGGSNRGPQQRDQRDRVAAGEEQEPGGETEIRHGPGAPAAGDGAEDARHAGRPAVRKPGSDELLSGAGRQVREGDARFEDSN